MSVALLKQCYMKPWASKYPFQEHTHAGLTKSASVEPRSGTYLKNQSAAERTREQCSAKCRPTLSSGLKGAEDYASLGITSSG